MQPSACVDPHPKCACAHLCTYLHVHDTAMTHEHAHAQQCAQNHFCTLYIWMQRSSTCMGNMQVKHAMLYHDGLLQLALYRARQDTSRMVQGQLQIEGIMHAAQNVQVVLRHAGSLVLCMAPPCETGVGRDSQTMG